MLQYNQQKLRELHQPVAKVKAEHSCSAAKQATSKTARGLKQTLNLAKNARIRLTKNLWTEAGLYNGAQGVTRTKRNLFRNDLCCIESFDKFEKLRHRTHGI